MEQGHPNGPVFIRGRIEGLDPGPHGFHVHAKGQLGNDCKDAGGHFNPFMARLYFAYCALLSLASALTSIFFQKKHGDPNAIKTPFASSERHVGDLGNIKTLSRHHPTQVFKIDDIITLQEGMSNSIMGKALVLHAGKNWDL